MTLSKGPGKEWAEITGRPFNLVDAWGTEDADYIIVVLGSCAGNARFQARQLRAQGKKVGVVRSSRIPVSIPCTADR